MSQWARVFVESKQDEDHRAQHVAVEFLGPRGRSMIVVLSRNGAQDLQQQLTKVLSMFQVSEVRLSQLRSGILRGYETAPKIRRGVRGRPRKVAA